MTTHEISAALLISFGAFLSGTGIMLLSLGLAQALK
jgi:hypothetical protein